MLDNRPTPTHHVFLLDGTTLDTTSPHPSHVCRLRIGLPIISSGDGYEYFQKVHYESGIGVIDWTSFGGFLRIPKQGVDRMLAFTFVSHVAESLSKLGKDYRKGDAITIIGFSRGAAAAMVMAKYIREIGVPGREEEEKNIREKVSSLVENRGLSARQNRQLVNRLILFDPVATTPFFSFENINFQTDDAEQIICCYSLDEDRLAFRQSQFRIPGKEKDDAEFAIFCGSHSDIGGTSASCLRDIPLRYALTKASTKGPKLVFQPEFLENLGLDEKDLETPRDPPYHMKKINYFGARYAAQKALEDAEKETSERVNERREEEARILLLRPDVLCIKCSMSKPAPFWKWLPKKRRNFANGGAPVRVHWTVVHLDEKFANSMNLPQPPQYTA